MKVVMHHGEVAMRKVKNFVKPAGEHVVLAHRLLKNSVKRNEYILMSEDYFKLMGGFEDKEFEAGVENCEGIGKVNTRVYYPNPPAEGDRFDASIWDKINLRAKLAADPLLRLFKLKEEREFKSLSGL